MLSRRLINRELGNTFPLYDRNTNWIVAAASAAASLASSLFGGAKARKERKKAAAEQKRREDQEQAWYDRRYNQDYLDTAAGQNLMRQANEYADKQWRKAEGAKAVGGGTDAATAMAKESANRMVGNTVANIAAQDESRKQSVDNTHQQNLQNFSNQTQARYNQQAADINTATQNASNAIMSMGSALESASSQKKVQTPQSKFQTPSQINAQQRQWDKEVGNKWNDPKNGTDLTGNVKTAFGEVPLLKAYKRFNG